MQTWFKATLKIDHDESTGPSCLGVFAKFVDTVLHEGIVVSNEDNRDGQTQVTGHGNMIQALNNLRRSASNGHLIGMLNSSSIRLWVRARDAKFNHTGFTLLHGQKNNSQCIFTKQAKKSTH